MISEQVARAFYRVACALLDMPPNPKEVGRWTSGARSSWREMVYQITDAYCQHLHPPPRRDVRSRTWLEATVHARDLVNGLWHNGPKDYVTDDLEVAAAIQFLSEELKWPERK